MTRIMFLIGTAKKKKKHQQKKLKLIDELIFNLKHHIGIKNLYT